MSAESDQKTPPYASYRSFVNYLDHLRENQPLPSRIDKGVMSHLNYGTQQALIQALRVLGLVGKDDAPTPRLEKLVAAAEKERGPILAEMLQASYPYLWDGKIDLSRASPAEFDERLKEATGVGGSTVDKAAAFFIAVAKDAGTKLSPHLLKRKATAASSNGSKRPRAKAKRDEKPEDGKGAGADADKNRNPPPSDLTSQLLGKFPNFDPQWPDQIKAKWFEGFERLMNSAEGKQSK